MTSWREYSHYTIIENIDRDAWKHELQQLKKFIDKTELSFKSVIEKEKEMYAAQDEELARQKADLRSQIEPLLQQETAIKRAREALLSKFTQEARDQYELDREKQRQRLQSDSL